uniref:non-specific serine/threonine protein kinase n=1 Tax=Ananas comosus var. bracteatus TaxID=296719 RepID=A0A6V7QGG2_ANACO|nr:unnamed protein product [Ananas comosus var. bracteatus]
MAPMRVPHGVLLLLHSALFFPQLCTLRAQKSPFWYRTTNLSTTWVNNDSLPHAYGANATGSDSTIGVRTILLHANPAGFGPSFACGFSCTVACDAFLFSVFIVYRAGAGYIINPNNFSPQVVWAANRDRPVGQNATLQLTETGDLILRDTDGTPVWSADTSNKNVAVLRPPTDTLVIGQSLAEGMRLTANVSAVNDTQGVSLYLTVSADGLRAYADSHPPQLYYANLIWRPKPGDKNSTYLTFQNGSLAIFTSLTDLSKVISIPAARTAQSVQFMRLESDGHLRLYEWTNDGPTIVDDVMGMEKCKYPTACGDYGVCSDAGQCFCPLTAYFEQVDSRLPDLGCAPSTPLTCQSMQDHELFPLNNITYFNYIDTPALQGVSEESCKQACLKNCSCKAALFRYGNNSYYGSCYLPSDLLSLQIHEFVQYYNSSAYIKVQNIPKSPASASPKSPAESPPESPAVPKTSSRKRTLLGSALGVGFFVMFLAISLVLVVRKCKKEEEEEPVFHQVPGMPRIFSFKELKEATDNFSKKLGEGGFGSVFEGKINDEKVAIKRLDGIGQGKKEFLAEIETIGSIHHINLVKMIGFCAQKTHRLLVYEHMCHGSLDKWIFYKDQVSPLDWQTRRKIILDIARGLSYLHEDCRQKIAHLDIKPQNILLDEKFNAKVSDFGLAKLIDRDQSEVVTRMRGTPGYLAPEWLTSIITEKADIYSFGIVVTEIICGRKNLDHSQPEESIHLITLLQEKAKTNRLLDLVDSHMNDLQLHEAEIIEMMELAMWCLQCDSNRRPSMSTVVKVLEGAMGVETNLEYNFVATGTPIPSKDDCAGSFICSSCISFVRA